MRFRTRPTRSIRRRRFFEQMEDRQLMAADLVGGVVLDPVAEPVVMDEAAPQTIEAEVEYDLPAGPQLPGPDQFGPAQPGPNLPGPFVPGPELPGPLLPIPSSDFVGTWTNVNENTGGITKIQITSDWQGDHSIEAWGACVPSDCEWGSTQLDLLGTSVSDTTPDYAIGHWDPGFKDTVITVKELGGNMVADVYSLFKDDSGRQDYHQRYRMTESGDLIQIYSLTNDQLGDVIVGGWVNKDDETRSMTKLLVSQDSDGLEAHGYGSCSPTDCDWGTTDMRAVGTSISDTSPHYTVANYDHGFKTQFITTQLIGSELVVEHYNVFHDDSGRSNYYNRNTMWKLGDANHDGYFNSSDLVAIMAAGEYEDDVDGNSTWEEGDFNRDGDFTSADLVEALSSGGYESQPIISRLPDIRPIDGPSQLDPIGPRDDGLLGGLNAQIVDELFDGGR